MFKGLIKMKNNLQTIIADLKDIIEVSDVKENFPKNVNQDYLKGVFTVTKETLKKLKDFEAELQDILRLNEKARDDLLIRNLEAIDNGDCLFCLPMVVELDLIKIKKILGEK